MFTTNNHIYLYIAGGIFALSSILFLLKKKTAGLLVLAAGLILYTLYLAGRGWIAGIFLPNPLVEGPYLLPWCLGVIAVFTAVRRDERWGLILIPILIFSAFAIWYAKGIIPPTPNKLTLWTIAFFVTELFAHACFYCGALYAAASAGGTRQIGGISQLHGVGLRPLLRGAGDRRGLVLSGMGQHLPVGAPPHELRGDLAYLRRISPPEVHPGMERETARMVRHNRRAHCGGGNDQLLPERKIISPDWRLI